MAAYISFQPSDFFNTTIYTGTGATHSVTGVGFQPDFTWIKQRNGTYRHQVYDSVRGAGYYLATNTTEVQSALDTAGLSAWGADGFTVNTRNQVNYNTGTFASWNWKAGTTSGITTDGATTITPSAYSFNTTSKFSILKYTGNGSNDAKVAHGLGAAPDIVLIKKTNAVGQWTMHHPGLATPNRQAVVLNTTDAVETDNYSTWSFWYNTNPDSVNFTLGDSTGWNNSGDTYVAYCWQGIQGYSKFGSYTGNGNADGTFVYTGFRPAWLMIKRSDSTGEWNMWDNKRLGYNPDNNFLQANSTAAEATADELNILSNGFKLTGTDGDRNASGGTYVYMAFAEFPFVSSNSKAGTAR